MARIVRVNRVLTQTTPAKADVSRLGDFAGNATPQANHPRPRGWLAVLLLSLAALPAAAQDYRRSLPVYIPAPLNGTQEQKAYFQGAFKMELIGTGYPLAEVKEESVYILELDIEDNPYFDPAFPADMDNSHFNLSIALLRTEDSGEVLRFSFGFNTTEEMGRWNLTLIYTAMANAVVPPGKEPPPAPPPAAPASPPDTEWANKVLYLTLGAGLDVGLFTHKTSIAHGSVTPLAWAGVEWRFWKYLSAELDPLRARALNTGQSRPVISLSPALVVKGVFFLSQVALEPYAGAEYGINFQGEAPKLSALGGIQLGFKAGKRSAVFLDLGASCALTGKVALANGKDYGLVRVTIAGGWKLGWWDYPPVRREKPAAAPSKKPPKDRRP